MNNSYCPCYYCPCYAHMEWLYSMREYWGYPSSYPAPYSYPYPAPYSYPYPAPYSYPYPDIKCGSEKESLYKPVNPLYMETDSKFDKESIQSICNSSCMDSCKSHCQTDCQTSGCKTSIIIKQ
jgi:hypothetical protein